MSGIEEFLTDCESGVKTAMSELQDEIKAYVVALATADDIRKESRRMIAQLELAKDELTVYLAVTNEVMAGLS